ncbi:hypothetical protein I5612_002424 [Salmonella enterica subsp. enterica serovar Oslo]|nr:hypothetical protein [Salmonella enterica subsp. enterica serovar Oslo]
MFPAPAGINRSGIYSARRQPSVPRASGDKPPYLLYQLGSARVFPAPAGINRASGDKPRQKNGLCRQPECSPRQRG